MQFYCDDGRRAINSEKVVGYHSHSNNRHFLDYRAHPLQTARARAQAAPMPDAMYAANPLFTTRFVPIETNQNMAKQHVNPLDLAMPTKRNPSRLRCGDGQLL